MPAFHIPPVNPVRFFKKGTQGDGYVQKYSPSDSTSLQVCSRVAEISCTLAVIDRYGKPVRYFEEKTSILGELYFFCTWQMDFAGLDGCYRIALTACDGYGAIEKYESGCIHVSPKNERLPVLHYRNTGNMDDINYEDVDWFSLRVEGGFQMKDYSPRSNDTIYRNVDLRFEMLHSDTYRTRMFTAGGSRGIPDDLHFIIHKAFGCDTVYVNLESYVKYEGAQWQSNEADNYSFRTWILEVIATGNELERDVKKSYRWTDYVCRVRNGAYTGYAAAMTLEVDGQRYFVNEGFSYGSSMYQFLMESKYAALSLNALNQRALAFIGHVESMEGVLEGIMETVKIPVNLINQDASLTNSGMNLITSVSVIKDLVLQSETCVEETEPALNVLVFNGETLQYHGEDLIFS